VESLEATMKLAPALLLSFSLPLGVGLLAIGCGGGSSGGGGQTAAATQTQPQTGELKVMLTDAPLRDLTGVTKVAVTVERLEIHVAGVGSSSQTGNGNAGQGNSGQGNNGQGNNGQGVASVNTNANPNSVAGGARAPGQYAGGANPNAQGNNPQAQASRGVAGVNSNSSSGGGMASGQGNGQGAGNVNAGGVAAVGSGGGSWITIYDASAGGPPKAFNLLDLRGGIMADLSTANLPPGRYDRMRLVVSDAELVRNQTSYSTTNGLLTIPAGATSGVTINFPGPDALTITAGQQTQVLLDFDLASSINTQLPAAARDPRGQPVHHGNPGRRRALRQRDAQ
jgi:Domain of unknown function (DUF4382)